MEAIGGAKSVAVGFGGWKKAPVAMFPAADSPAR